MSFSGFCFGKGGLCKKPGSRQEYGFFNQADVNLEKIIRDDASYCKITIDFNSEEKEYRLVRTRTKKGTTDISLFAISSISILMFNMASTNLSSSIKSSLSVGSIIKVPATGKDIVGAWNP